MKYIFAFSLMFIFNCSSLSAQTDLDAELSIFDLLQEKQVENIEIFADLEELVVKKSRTESSARIFVRVDGKRHMLKAELSVRGKFRTRVCDFPPLKINFKKSSLQELVGAPKYDKYKLVSHCLDNMDEAVINLQKEATVYKMYNEVTPYSFRVHELTITYTDIHDPSWSIEAPAFIIESNKQFEDRMSGEFIDTLGLTAKQIETDALENLMLFNYMIGNADWDIRVGRNVKLLWVEEKSTFIPVAYDFDFCSFVAPSYLRLFTSLGQKKWNDRILVSPFDGHSTLGDNLIFFEELKSRFDSLIRKMDKISETDYDRIKTFINSFYNKSIEDLRTMNTMKENIQVLR
jgi:hypothetical protein